MIVYKTVRRYGKRHRVSAFVGSDTHLLMRYPKGKRVKPRIGKCFAFETLADAMRWHLGNEIWEADATEVSPPPARIYGNIESIRTWLERIWEEKDFPLPRDFTSPPPQGTVCCSDIKPVKLVAVKEASGLWRHVLYA